jgi:hypothetical protein
MRQKFGEAAGVFRREILIYQYVTVVLDRPSVLIDKFVGSCCPDSGGMIYGQVSGRY